MVNENFLKKKVLKNGREVYFFDFHYENDGIMKRTRRRLGTNLKRAEKKYRKIMDAIESGIYKKDRKEEMLFKRYSEIFIERHAEQKRSVKRFKGIIGNLNSFFGNKYLSRISADDIERYRTMRLAAGIKQSTSNRELACIKVMYSRAILWGYANVNPSQRIKLFKESRTTTSLDDSERIKLLEACKKIEHAPHLYWIVYFALNTGCRIGEILSLKWQNVDLKNGYIYILPENSKSGKEKHIPINNNLLNALKFDIKKPNTEYVFCDNSGRSFKSVKTAFNKAKRISGIVKRYTFHTLRHTFGTIQANEAKTPLNIVQELMGHASIQTTMRYIHGNEQLKKQAVENLAEVLSLPKQDGIKMGNFKATAQKEPKAENSEIAKYIEK